MSLYPRGRIWWLYIVHQGVRVRQSCKTSDREVAQRVHDEVRAQLWKLKTGGLTVHGVLEKWKAAAPRNSADLYRVEKLKRRFPDVPAGTVDAAALVKAIPQSSPATFNRYANIILSAFRLAKIEPPELGYRKPSAGRLRWLTPKEWRRLRKELPPHLKDMAEFALLTGLRQHNVTHLEWSQVDLRRKRAWIHADQAKGRDAIGVPLSDAACAILKRRKGKSGWVFPYQGKPMGQIKGAWKKALARAKIEGFTWHGLRHTWASWHAIRGTPIPALKELGAWKTLSMVQRYAHLAPEHLRRYVQNPVKFSKGR